MPNLTDLILVILGRTIILKSEVTKGPQVYFIIPEIGCLMKEGFCPQHLNCLTNQHLSLWWKICPVIIAIKYDQPTSYSDNPIPKVLCKLVENWRCGHQNFYHSMWITRQIQIKLQWWKFGTKLVTAIKKTAWQWNKGQMFAFVRFLEGGNPFKISKNTLFNFV